MGLDLGSSLPPGLTNLLQNLLLLVLRPALYLGRTQVGGCHADKQHQPILGLVHALPLIGQFCCKPDMWLQPQQVGADQLTHLAYKRGRQACARIVVLDTVTWDLW